MIHIRVTRAIAAAITAVIGAIVMYGTIQFATGEWKDSANGREVISSYIQEGNLTFYGDYCRADGTVLDGGTVCRAYVTLEPVSLGERLVDAVSIGVVGIVLAVMLMIIAWTFLTMEPRQPEIAIRRSHTS